MAVKDKRKAKPRNQSTRMPSNLSNNAPKSRVSKGKRVEQKKRQNPSKKGKGKKSKSKQKQTKPENSMDLNQKWNSLKQWVMRSKQMIFWIVVLSLMFVLRFNEEGFGAFQRVRSKEDLYKVLESEPHFSAKQIKKQYRKLVGEFHPDTNPNCKICEDKITSINKAYEVLKDPEARKIYDQTKGIVDPIRSSAKNLDQKSFREKVVEGDRPIVIQIYAENSERSKSFAGFWEDFIVEHSYLDYARINMSTEPKLANSLGFGVDELPFIFSHVPGRDYEFFEFNEYYEGSTSVLLNRFVKQLVKKNADVITFKDFLQMERQPKQISVIFVRREFSPLVYEYLALRFKKYPQVKFFTTAMNEHKKFYKHFKKYDMDYVMLMPKEWEEGTRVISINSDDIQAGGNLSSDEEGSSESESFVNKNASNNEEFKTPKKILKHYIVTNYLKSQMVPSLERHSFTDFCKKDFTSFDGQMALPTVCVVALDGPNTGNFPETLEKLEKLRSGLESQAFQQMIQSKESFNIHVHRFQFASVDLKKNPKFAATLVDSLPVKKPRVLVYLSESEQFMLINSFQDLDDVIEDAMEGVFDDYRSYRAMLSKDVPIENLLRNENISLFMVVNYEVRLWFWRAVGLLIAMMVLNAYVMQIPTDKLMMGYVVILALFLGFVVTEKMVRELVW